MNAVASDSSVLQLYIMKDGVIKIKFQISFEISNGLAGQNS